jgi:hypothetical protein
MITTLALVKTIGQLFDKSGEGAPTTATVGQVGDVYMDTATGLSYECKGFVTPNYIWEADLTFDAIINIYIQKAENDYLLIRGIPFAVEDGDIVYPDAADLVAAEMVCYNAGYGQFFGRGVTHESLNGRVATYDQKLYGYPLAIVGSIKRYQAVV